MIARWVLVVGASVVLGGPSARAAEREGAAAGEKKELSGRVIKSEPNTLYVEHVGVVVPMEIGQETRFSGVRSAAELAKGQEVRASFTVKNDTENVAESISLGAPPTRRARERAPTGYQENQDYGG
ncbi:MAG TPA: hypothetical protein VF912_21405 [Anaeromyxobacter sp.]